MIYVLDNFTILEFWGARVGTNTLNLSGAFDFYQDRQSGYVGTNTLNPNSSLD
jgi:hypothetical protein